MERDFKRSKFESSLDEDEFNQAYIEEIEHYLQTLENDYQKSKNDSEIEKTRKEKIKNIEKIVRLLENYDDPIFDKESGKLDIDLLVKNCNIKYNRKHIKSRFIMDFPLEEIDSILTCLQKVLDHVFVILPSMTKVGSERIIEELKLIKDHISSPNVLFNGKTALYEAVWNDNHDVITYLLSLPNINPNVRSRNRETPLIRAIIGSNLKNIRLLMEHPETNPNLTDITGNTPLIIALRNDFEGKENQTFEIIKAILSGKNVVNISYKYYGISAYEWSKSPLFKVYLMEYALKNKISTPIPTDQYFVELSKFFDQRIAKDRMNNLLLNNLVSSPNVKDTSGKTALHFAVENKNLIVLEYLLSLPNIDPNVSDINGITPLMRAVMIKEKTFVEKILEHLRTNVNSMDKNGVTSLMIAANINDSTTSSDLMKLLLRYGANVWLTNNKKQTTFEFCANAECRDILINLMLKVNVKDLPKDMSLLFVRSLQQRIICYFLYPNELHNLATNVGISKEIIESSTRTELCKMVSNVIASSGIYDKKFLLYEKRQALLRDAFYVESLFVVGKSKKLSLEELKNDESTSLKKKRLIEWYENLLKTFNIYSSKSSIEKLSKKTRDLFNNHLDDMYLSNVDVDEELMKFRQLHDEFEVIRNS